MRFGMWPEENIEARYSFGPEEREDSRPQKPIWWKTGGVSLHEDRPLEGGGGGARLMILLVGGTVLLVLLAGILGIMDAIGGWTGRNQARARRLRRALAQRQKPLWVF